MATNLDRSLDEILDDKKKARRVSSKKSAPVGGVRKRSARIEKKKTAAPPSAPAADNKKGGKKDKTDTKIVVSNLPFDVSEHMIREYFTQVVGPVKKCQLSYKANGQSSGVATIEFSKPGHANVAFEQYNGRLVDNRPMKVEIVFDPTKASLADRINAPAPAKQAKATPKPANAKPKPVTAASNGNSKQTGARRGAKPAARGGKAAPAGRARRSKKSKDDLDQEMADYFKPGENAPAAQPQTAADAAAQQATMDDL